MGKQCTREDVIKRFQDVHKGKWIYDKFEYYNMHIKSIITCPVHGDFMMTPHAHLKGQGCPKCGILIRTDKKKKIQLIVLLKKLKINIIMNG